VFSILLGNSRTGYACGLYLGDPSAGSTIEVVAEELGAEPPLATASTTRTTRNQHQ
jgi:hypothetical protein